MNCNKPTQEFIMVLNLVEYAPFVYFLNRYSLPVELVDKRVAKHSIECTLIGAPDFDPLVAKQIWHQWKDESMEWEYVILN